MKIIIGGDLVPTLKNIEKFKSNNLISNIKKDFRDFWFSADYRIINLETVLGSSETLKPIEKSGPNLIANSKSINGIKSLMPNLVCLANNHSMDYGIEGLTSSINLLKTHEISYTGIVKNNISRILPCILEKDGIRVGIYNVCENEFNQPQKDSIGCNCFDEIETYKDIFQLKKHCDYIIVIYHGGKEYYRFPSPKIKKTCENFIDFGADVVLTQHSHCIGSEEIYKSKTILYGQGNFIFDTIDNDFLNYGLLVEVVANKEKININYKLIEKENNLIKLSDNRIVYNEFKERSKKTNDNDYLEKLYYDFSSSKIESYLATANINSFYRKSLNKLYHMFFHKSYYLKMYNTKKYLDILNSIRCESHRELFIEGIKYMIERQNHK